MRLAAEYDYPAAARLLKGDPSVAAHNALKAISLAQKRARPWPTPLEVSHLFYHSLIVDPARAFAKNQPQRVGYAQYMVTLSEFRAQLQQIYRHGYVLVHPQRLVAKDAAGTMRPATLMLPPGRKPLVLSIDDVNYYTYMDGAGFASNLTVSGGQVTNTYVDAQGVTHLGAYDVPTVIDEFVRQHPDFSYRGDKGSIAETGYNGVLGYRSSIREYGDTPHTREQAAQAKAVATALKAEGWHFASHSWGHISFTTSSMAQIQLDTKLWDAEVRPLVGRTDEFVYPFGADISGMATYSSANPKFHLLHDVEGYDYFFPIDATKASWSQLTPNSWRQARINIDGISMQRELSGMKTALENFFITRSTIDPLRPLPTPTGQTAQH
ncbi:hydrolase [Nocardioides baekrokdamisoli]|uniref:Hydrolase n=1 Tax=Nocardioides baekrokdamisoli TaxID=1804624 RepID=A0A3G9J1I8_9ACTN|nr:hydrolase [Nocardioides baekrokdamisoli]